VSYAQGFKDCSNLGTKGGLQNPSQGTGGQHTRGMTIGDIM
jgi:hypothetical protein